MSEGLWAAVAVLATNGLVEAVHRGSLFAGVRAWAEAGDGLHHRLVGCPFCLSFWVGVAVTVPCVASALVPEIVVGWPFAGVAVARAAQLLHDVTRSISRTPRSSEPSEPDEPAPREPANAGDEIPDELRDVHQFLTDALITDARLRSVAVIRDYRGDLNQTEPGFLWLSRGEGTAVDVAGMLGQTIAAHNNLFNRLVHRTNAQIEAYKAALLVERAARTPVDEDPDAPDPDATDAAPDGPADRAGP